MSRPFEAAVEGQAHVVPRAVSPDQQGAGAHVRLYFLFLFGAASDSFSQTVSVATSRGRRQLRPCCVLAVHTEKAQYFQNSCESQGYNPWEP